MLEDVQIHPKQQTQHYKCIRKKGQFKLQSTETKQKRHDNKRNHKTTKKKITQQVWASQKQTYLLQNTAGCCRCAWSPLLRSWQESQTWISISWAKHWAEMCNISSFSRTQRHTQCERSQNWVYVNPRCPQIRFFLFILVKLNKEQPTLGSPWYMLTLGLDKIPP